MKRISRDMEMQLVQAYESSSLGGHSLAQQFGVGASTLYRVLRRNGVPIDPAKRHELDHGARRYKFSESEQATIAQLYADGVKPKELSRRFHCHAWTIRAIVKRGGLSLLRRGGQLRPWSDSEIQRAVTQYASGMSQEAIAADFKTHQSTVSRILISAGVDTRRPRWAAHPNWKGGRVTTGEGYIAVMMDTDSPFASMRMATGYVLEHRLVLAQKLGRPLLRTETVHHINGVRDDNRPENLELRVGKHGKGVVLVCMDCGSHNVRTCTLKTVN